MFEDLINVWYNIPYSSNECFVNKIISINLGTFTIDRNIIKNNNRYFKYNRFSPFFIFGAKYQVNEKEFTEKELEKIITLRNIYGNFSTALTLFFESL